MRGKAPAVILASVLLLTVLSAHFSIPSIAQTSGGTTVRRYSDKTEDVISESAKRTLDRFIDIEELEGEEDNDFEERRYIDLVSMTIMENDTYVSFSLQTYGGIKAQKEYVYMVAGYTRKDFRTSDPFDFILRFSEGNATYGRWADGSFVLEDNISSFDTAGSSLNITMNRGRFVLASRQTPLFATAVALLDTGPGKDRRIDHLETRKLLKDERGGIDDTTLIMIQLAVFGFIFLVIMVLWNIWARKKGMDQAGGVCPKCESRLDSKLDFCPSCGTFVRGPLTDARTEVKPRIVEGPGPPPDKEE